MPSRTTCGTLMRYQACSQNFRIDDQPHRSSQTVLCLQSYPKLLSKASLPTTTSRSVEPQPLAFGLQRRYCVQESSAPAPRSCLRTPLHDLTSITRIGLFSAADLFFAESLPDCSRISYGGVSFQSLYHIFQNTIIESIESSPDCARTVIHRLRVRKYVILRRVVCCVAISSFNQLHDLRTIAT